MQSEYIAHRKEDTGEIQTVKAHSEETAELCREYAVDEMKQAAYVAGLYHDLGKYGYTYQRRIRGTEVRVEHSTCGALVAKERYPYVVGLLLGFCIAGHHTGLPDAGSKKDGPDDSTLYGRMKRSFEDFSAYKEELSIPEINEQEFMQFLLKDCGKDIGMVVDKFAFLTRYVFSCLVDADSTNTADFCRGYHPKHLKADFPACLGRINHKLRSFVCETDLQKARSQIQEQVYEKVNENAEIYLLNMPTGSGKTLCSIKWALERAIAGQKKRIIYIAPFNSIIDQTADELERLFRGCADILRHQSTFCYEDQDARDEDYLEAVKNAEENWDADMIITTEVQFFESIYSNKRGKLRKFHNMADSVLIFDEAHLMPLNYLQPCLQAVAFITRYLNSEAVFLTATMPDYQQLLSRYALPDCKVVNLVEDYSKAFLFKKCDYVYLGKTEAETLLSRALQCPSSLIVVNRRQTATALFHMGSGRKYHLSTYMTVLDRKRVIDEVKEELRKLEADYPGYENIPEERRIMVISTSLIEAGVDLDFYAVFRELSGLDNILQAGGRCNREGRRAHAETYVFELSEEGRRNVPDRKINLTRGLIRGYEDISDKECVREYYERYYFMNQDAAGSHVLSAECKDISCISFKSYADHFELIDSRTVSVVVRQNEDCEQLLNLLKFTGIGTVRKLQKYTCSVQVWELNDLIRQNAVKEADKGVWYLANMDYYDSNTGISFEAKDYLIE